MAMALPRRRSWASMKARCGSQAEAVAATGGSDSVGLGAGGHAGGICRHGDELLLVTADRLAIDPT